MRRFIALVIALSILSTGLSGCSQPIDTGSSVPAQSQPIVALLALLGLGIGLTAWHHHNEAHHGGGGGPAIVGANFSVASIITGYKPTDLVVDQFNATLGAVVVPTSGVGAGKFTEIQVQSGVAFPFGTYTLPGSYAPTAVSMDSNGVTWFVDAAGRVQGCDAMTTTSTTCTSIGTFTDGLGTGSRSIAVDVNFIVVIMDAGGGKVKWWAEQGSTATGTGTYTPSSTSAVYPVDAIELSTTSPSGFTVYHQDGSSDFITFTVTGTVLTVNLQPNFAFNPAPLTAPSNFLTESTRVAFFSFTGAPTGSYFLTKYATATNVGIGQPTTASQLIDFNGQVGNPGTAPFSAPLSSAHADALESSVWAIDSTGRIVNFTPF